MNVLFASGDVGGARALLPVMALCEKELLPFVMLEHGHIVSEAPGRWKKVSPGDQPDATAVESAFKRNDIGVLVFTSSVKDTLPLTLARRARELDIPVVHVLDNWTGYRRRMEKDGMAAFTPDVYTVPDALACEEAVMDGIDRSIVKITGQPALASLCAEYRSREGRDGETERKRLGIDPARSLVVFVSEPAEDDQGASPASPQFRGYTEKTVLPLFCEALQPHADAIEMGILPHPREDRNRLAALWEQCRGSLTGTLLHLDTGRGGLFVADAVAGMASLLLYEAWLLGRPVISLQPGLRQAQLRMLQKRSGVIFVDSHEEIIPSVASWVATIQAGNRDALRPEAQLHKNAPGNIFRLVKELLNRKSFRKVINS
ncbi:MAG: hypothetical protein JXI32_05220 [Deltaproteobacteria bacterium]|nr:hypothetical protein [Deltaproteobacteria bacterium]